MPLIRHITRACVGLLRLCPERFRDEFEEEMQAVFSETIVEAAEDGAISVAAVCLPESWDSAPSLFQQHLLDRGRKGAWLCPIQ